MIPATERSRREPIIFGTEKVEECRDAADTVASSLSGDLFLLIFDDISAPGGRDQSRFVAKGEELTTEAMNAMSLLQDRGIISPDFPEKLSKRILETLQRACEDKSFHPEDAENLCIQLKAIQEIFGQLRDDLHRFTTRAGGFNSIVAAAQGDYKRMTGLDPHLAAADDCIRLVIHALLTGQKPSDRSNDSLPDLYAQVGAGVRVKQGYVRHRVMDVIGDKLAPERGDIHVDTVPVLIREQQYEPLVYAVRAVIDFHCELQRFEAEYFRSEELQVEEMADSPRAVNVIPARARSVSRRKTAVAQEAEAEISDIAEVALPTRPPRTPEEQEARRAEKRARKDARRESAAKPTQSSKETSSTKKDEDTSKNNGQRAISREDAIRAVFHAAYLDLDTYDRKTAVIIISLLALNRNKLWTQSRVFDYTMREMRRPGSMYDRMFFDKVFDQLHALSFFEARQRRIFGIPLNFLPKSCHISEVVPQLDNKRDSFPEKWEKLLAVTKR